MDGSHDPTLDDDAFGSPPARDEASVRAMLEQSRRDIAAGRIVALEPVLDRMRAAADGIRLGGTKDSKAGRRRA
jgi:hypothetical protein